MIHFVVIYFYTAGAGFVRRAGGGGVADLSGRWRGGAVSVTRCARGGDVSVPRRCPVLLPGPPGVADRSGRCRGRGGVVSVTRCARGGGVSVPRRLRFSQPLFPPCSAALYYCKVTRLVSGLESTS